MGANSSTSKQQPHSEGRRTRPFWIWLAAPVVLLLAEVMSLTPFVEFTHGPMQFVGEPLLFSGTLIALASFWLLTAPHWRGLGAGGESLSFAGRARRGWLMVHAGLLVAFFALSIDLNGRQGSELSWVYPAVWFALGCGVAASALLIFVPLPRWIDTLKCCGMQAAAAAMIGIAFVLLIPLARSTWPYAQGLASKMAYTLLGVFPGEAIHSYDLHRWPILGAGKVQILVTPACAEMESLLAFLILGGTLLVARWRELSPWRFSVLLSVGVMLLYCVNAVRLAGLVLAGVAFGSAMSVRLAHSRVSGILFVAASLAILHYGCRLCRRPNVAEPTYDAEPEPAIAETTEPALAPVASESLAAS